MSTTVTIGGLTLVLTANLTGAATFEIEDATGTSAKTTAALLRTKLFAGGTGFTASDPLVCGTLNASGAVVIAAGGLAVNGGTSSFAATVTITGVSGTSALVANTVNGFAAQLNGGTTTNQSFGLAVNAGTSASDQALLVRSGNAGSVFLQILGNGNLAFFGVTPVGRQVSGGTVVGVIAGLIALGLFSS